MGRRGPPKAPPSVKIAAGTYRADRDGPIPAAPQSFVLSRPASLGEHGSRVWDTVAPKLQEMGLLAPVDVFALERYCRTHDEIAKLDEALADGDVYVTAQGQECPRPQVAMRAKWIDTQMTCEKQLGLTIAARVGLPIVVESVPKDMGLQPRKRG